MMTARARKRWLMAYALQQCRIARHNFRRRVAGEIGGGDEPRDTVGLRQQACQSGAYAHTGGGSFVPWYIPAKAIALVAAFELGSRCRDEERSRDVTVRSSDDAFNYIRGLLENLDHEEFWVMVLSRANRIPRPSL